MRAPRSPSGCGLSVMRKRATSLRNVVCVPSGAHHNVTGPTSAASAVATARSVRRSCSTAAACAPIVGMSRVLASPGIGAFARIAMATELLLRGGITILSRKLRRVGAEEIGQPQPPHQDYRSQRAVFLPPAGRGCNARAKTKRAGDAFKLPGQTNVFHKGDWRKASGGIERSASDEQGLVA